MKYLPLIILLLAMGASVFGQEAATAGREAVLSPDCSVAAQYALAGSTVNSVAFLKKLLESDPSTPDRSKNICAEIDRITGYSQAIRSITDQEREAGSTEKFNGTAAPNFMTAMERICGEAVTRPGVKLSPDEEAKFETLADRYQKFLVKMRGDMAAAYPHLAGAKH